MNFDCGQLTYANFTSHEPWLHNNQVKFSQGIRWFGHPIKAARIKNTKYYDYRIQTRIRILKSSRNL